MSNIRFQLLQATKSEWELKNPVLREGEPGIEISSTDNIIDNTRIKVGNGSTPWNSLPYSSKDVYSYNELTTVDLGGIPKGTNLKDISLVDIIKDLTTPYVKPSFSVFTTNNVSQLEFEVGTVLANNYVLNWNINQLSNVADNTTGLIASTDSNAFTGLGSVNLRDLTKTLTSATGYTKNLPDNLKLTVTGQDVKGSNIGNKEINFDWLGKVRYGVRTSGITTQSHINGLSNSFLSDKERLIRVYDFSIGKPFIAIPEFIDVSGIKFIDNDNGLEFSMATQSTFDNTLPELVSFNNGNTTFNYRIFSGEFIYNADTSIKIEF